MAENEKTIWKIIDAASKILIPIVLGIIAWNQNNFSIELQKAQQQRDTQLKLIEITWNSLIGDNERSKNISLSLLRSVDAEIAVSIASAISQDTTQNIVRRQQAAQIAADFSYSILEGTKIDIYYLDGSNEADALFDKISGTIQQLDLDNKIIRAKKPLSWVKSVGNPRNNEIRYYAATEEKIAEALAAVLNSAHPNDNFQLRPVRTKTPGTVAIVLGSSFKAAASTLME